MKSANRSIEIQESALRHMTPVLRGFEQPSAPQDFTCRSARPLWHSPRTMRWSWWWVLPLVGLTEWLAQGVLLRPAPDLADWAGVASHLGPRGSEPALLLVSPAWAEPMARAALDPSWWPIEQLARPDDDGFATALQVLTPEGTQRPPDGWRLVSEESWGPFRLRRLESTGVKVARFDAVARFGPTTSEARLVGPDGLAHDCVWTAEAPTLTGGLGGLPTLPPQRWQCGRAVLARTIIDDQAFSPRQCIWVTLPAEGAVVLGFQQVALGRHLVGHLGAPWLTHRDDEGPPVQVTVMVNGVPQGKLAHRGVDGWAPFSLDWGSVPAEGLLELRFEAGASSSRGVCVQVVTR
jgi:hypothetical protein